ncbi:GNAT family N-acetyltransferase [Aurantibacter sp.]|uniref:GNAT family N-acetyltransferase n=1 Tax=Aurantibacter sp. TaxID=2807103 RepID=UPI0035C7BC51
MNLEFRFLSIDYIDTIVDMVFLLDNEDISKSVLKTRFKEMFTQNYECIGIYASDKLIGVCGLWYMTRHYSGKSVEIDHVIINEDLRGKGLGKKLFIWLDNYLKTKQVETIELNTYTGNTDSHKFYYNEGFKILGFHFLKTL